MAVRSRAVNAAHTAGIFADMSLDGPEIGTLVAVIDRAKNLPNRKTMGKQDPYCAMRLGKEAKKTETDKRGGQTPKWDQELRFNVHDSPDYYKLKCSIFNDDKKTDLIGEAWIDLHEVIVPGGGQNDLWHQLNFKGKYAGDIRIELTYYDTRPKPEASPERKRQREKAHSAANQALSTSPGSRQLGPREIKRRPLPPGPGEQSSPASGPHTPDLWPWDPSPDMWTSHGYSSTNPPPQPPKQRIPETPDDFGYDLQPQYPPDDPYEQPPPSHIPHNQRHLPLDYHNNYEQGFSPHEDPGNYGMDTYEPRALPGQPPHSYHSGGSPGFELDQSPTPYSPHNISNPSPYNSSPIRTPPLSAPPMPAQNQSWQNRSSTSPTKHPVYRDSPLRQSISQVDMPQLSDGYADARFDEDQPPPPPVHRGPVSRTPMAPVSHQSPREHPSPRTPAKHSSVEERSPLQRLERGFDPHMDSSPYSRDFQRQLPRAKPHDVSPQDDYDRFGMSSSDRRESYHDNKMQLRPTSPANNVPMLDQVRDRPMVQPGYSENTQQTFGQSTGYGPPRKARAFENSDERQIRRSEPVVVRPRAISPNPAHTIPRKSITPTSAMPEGRRMSDMPFGPDSYDVLNPGTSPPVQDDSYAATDEGKEASRQKEVDKLRDQGPIIGNDGRIIDPSDHLPADTWAPEPERKNRKPEHVIKIRTKEEARMQNRTGSSPASTRPHSIATSSYQGSPNGALPSPYQASSSPPAIPTSPPTGSRGGGRNRLKKPMPNRPLPTQPYPHPHTSPAVMAPASVEDHPRPSSQRCSTHSSPAGGLPQRPPLSEYQVPATSNYNPRGGPNRPEYPVTPTKVPLHRSNNSMEYGEYGGDGSLALELSTIDIGPSRMGRTALRPSKDYRVY
ncbi:uncharacterized protein Z518_09677 [Rhinocladiella mackenziei CBS 650.93]|uniref:C2 domain-containing protein n=1 Tax=Rhinocladiella mackenziei CBS 650.93 TaxID=1442369 RepID=A0A0D2FF26_9EURO|nr:uncharacterized protein Z518_09677 [Rhinocladiella mackenziei CBS 650.93]KIX00612.1 hypothetical protein Z518_09677 [Rhinocladiella mackenziei CBS 650.93]